MRVGRLLPVLALVAVAACGGGGDAGSDSTGATSSPTTAPSTSTAPTIPPATTTSPGPATSTTVARAQDPSGYDAALALVVPAPEGLALWQGDRVDWLVTERAVAAAVPDLTGGVLFQHVDTAEPEWVWDDSTHRWVMTWPSGEPEPILRQRTLGGAVEVAVPTNGARLWLLDVGMLHGEPAVAFGRLVGGDEPIAVGFDHCAEAGLCGDVSWRVELVVRPIDGGAERVVHEALWQPGITESTAYTARWGRDLAALSVHPAPEEAESWGAVRLLDLDGASVDAGLRAAPWCTDCDVVADLAPATNALAYVERARDPVDGRLTASAEAVLFETGSRIERWRIDVSGGETIDTDGNRVVIATESTCPDDIGPALAQGDEGSWVERLQLQLNRVIGADLDVDGRYGPATERAVVKWQELRRLPLTGTVDSATWSWLLPDRSCTTEVVAVEGGHAAAFRLDIGWGIGDPAARSGAPNRGPAIWIGGAPEVAGEQAPADVPSSAELDELAMLRADGIGPYTFGTEADEVQAWLAEQLGEPDTEIVEDGAGGWPLPSCAERRFSYWAAAGLTVGFTDLNSYDPTGTVADCDDTPHLAGWYVVDQGPPWFAPGHGEEELSPIELQLTTTAGIGLGATAGELRAAEPSVEFGEWDIDEYAPAIFQTRGSSTTPACDCGMRGRVAWNHVADVQRALNERGASLAVDGTLGPRTEAALTEFQTSNDIDEYRIGPLTLDALGVAVPDDAPVVYLAAGRWDWWF